MSGIKYNTQNDEKIAAIAAALDAIVANKLRVHVDLMLSRISMREVVLVALDGDYSPKVDDLHEAYVTCTFSAHNVVTLNLVGQDAKNNDEWCPVVRVIK